MQTIFLIGFMGSGKSTFGKELAAKLNFRFIDLDEEIRIKNQESPKESLRTGIKNLIERKGMDFFRKAENETLKSLALDKAVISTGGGTPCYFDSLDWMKRRGVVVFLNPDEETIYNRLKNTELHERPLLKNLNDEGLKNFIHTKLAERLPYYNQAHIIFNPVEEKLEELLIKLQKYKHADKE